MEIYRQRVNKIWFEAPDSTSVVSATVSLNGGTPQSIPVNGNGATEPTKFRSVDVPYINDEGALVVEWGWSGASLTKEGLQLNATSTKKDTYDVVTPILSDSQILQIHPAATSDEIERIEKAVRHVINAHTGQQFGRYVGVKKVSGSGGRLLLLPARLLSLSTVNGSSNGFSITGDGYILRQYPWGVPPVKADYYGLHMHTGGVIHNPNDVKLGYFTASTYEIDGVWGWEEVPEQVAEAAKLLVNDYACADAAYRDRYLSSMTAADWRIAFNSGAYIKTGNARADLLLSEFVLKRGWAVL